MLEKYMDEQRVVTTLLKKSIQNNKIVQAYLFYSDDIEYIYKYAKDFSKEIIAKDLDTKDNICKKIDEDIYSELKIVEPISNNIKKEQLIDLQKEVQNKPIEGNKIVYIIKNCEKLTAASSNSILKFLEEPADDIVAILLTDNISYVLPTIKSRCQVVNFNRIKKDKNENTYDLFYNLLIFDNSDPDDINKKIDAVVNFIENIETKGINEFIYIKNIWDVIKNQQEYNIFVSIMIYFYMDVLYSKIGKEIKYMYNFTDIVDLVKSKNTLNDIINKIYVLEQAKLEGTNNVNNKLLLDKIIIELGGEKHE